jgi:prepilin-type N-terminal cleavage/methylation domain-containing protein/prepilin-type processing-associated H-X9-DG protein
MKNSNHRQTHLSASGFTLVELLVVILIVVVLAAFSFLGLSRMRAAGDRATTVAVLRQLQIANVGYAADHNGQYVPLSSMDENNKRVNDWHESSVFLAYLTGDHTNLERSQPVTSSVPVSILDPIVVRAKKRLWNRLFASYGYNDVAMPALVPGGDRSFKVSQVTNPARTAAFITATDWIANYGGRLLWKKSPVEGKTADSKIAYRHGDRAVVAYYDGHGGTISLDEMRAIDKKGGINNVFWGGEKRAK